LIVDTLDSIDFEENNLTKKFVSVKIERILTDCGTEYRTESRSTFSKNWQR